MAEQNIDVLMKVVSKGVAMPAGSGTEFSVGQVVDKLRQGFETGKISELQSFNFAVGLASLLSASAAENEAKQGGAAGAQAPGQKPPQKSAQKSTQKTQQQQIEALKAQLKGKSGKNGQPEVVDMQPVEFTRVFDTASTLLFQALVTCETIDSITIVKRKAAGVRNSGLIFLRLDFKDVLLTNLDWKDSVHYVEETGSFIYRDLTVQYRPQRSDGSLGEAIQANWKMKV